MEMNTGTRQFFVDSYEDFVMKGRFFNPYLEAPVHFSSAVHLIREIDKMLDEM